MENIGVPAQFRLVSFATPSVNVLMQEDPSRHFQLLLRKRVALEIFQALVRFFAGDLPRMLDTSAPFLQRYSLLQSKQRLSVVYFWLDGIEQLQNFNQRLENLPEGAVAVEHAT